jgi:dTDP-4-dehydrorhamnose 3,5-epimerase
MAPILLSSRRFDDPRGWFSETYNAKRAAAAGVHAQFCQDNQSFSREAGTLRGIHFQAPPFEQAKLVRCLRGAILDVIVDLRRASPTFGQWRKVELTAVNGLQLFVPRGYGHAFLTLEPNSEVAYKVDHFYDAEADGGIAWNDPAVGIEWDLRGREPMVSAKDAALPALDALKVEFPYCGTPLGDLNAATI